MSVTISWGKSDIIGADWNQVVRYLNVAKKEGGIIDLRSHKSTLSLQVDAGQDLYLPIFDPYFRDKVDLRFYHDPTKEMRQIYFDGNLEYDALLTDDFNLVLRLAREFFDTGDVKCMLPEKDLPPAIDDYEDD